MSWWSETLCVGVSSRGKSALVPHAHPSPHLMHATTIDFIWHLAFVRWQTSNHPNSHSKHRVSAVTEQEKPEMFDCKHMTCRMPR